MSAIRNPRRSRGIKSDPPSEAHEAFKEDHVCLSKRSMQSSSRWRCMPHMCGYGSSCSRCREGVVPGAPAFCMNLLPLQEKCSLHCPNLIHPPDINIKPLLTRSMLPQTPAGSGGHPPGPILTKLRGVLTRCVTISKVGKGVREQ